MSSMNFLSETLWFIPTRATAHCFVLRNRETTSEVSRL
jgi:hypothetical protein